MTDVNESLALEDEAGMEPIAVVGMALHVPGASTLDAFWKNLRDGVESTSFFNDDELRAAGVSDSTLNNPDYVKAFGRLEGAELFDAEFFELTPREAEILDPQHRQMMECSWEALENAGYAPGSLNQQKIGNIGLFGGVGLNGYLLHNLINRQDLIETLGGWQITLGNDKDFALTRTAYKLDLRGPVANISTACSTSLVAVGMGCQSLLSYQCDMVLAGGCSIHLPQDEGYWYHSGGTLSPDGHCRAFDENAQGTLDANGVAIVVLKRLDDAIADGDTIHGVIRGFAINNDGAVKVGYTAPSVEGQTAVIREAQQLAGVTADTIGYVETHGTGTDLGDLVEISALKEAFAHDAVTKNACGLGSVKTNVGHLDTAAGTASLIKTLLGLTHQTIPPSLHFKQANPKLELEQSPFYVNNRVREWPRLNGAPRRAGVSSFGIGGTNAHIVVEESPPINSDSTESASGKIVVLPLSARSESALTQAKQNLAAYLREHEVSVEDVATTLQCGRRSFSDRCAVLARTREDVLETLDVTSKEIIAGHAGELPPAVVFLFPGQDTQYAGMAKQLYQDEALFRREVDQCADILQQAHGIDLLARLFPSSPTPDYANDPLPLFVVEYALARYWQSLGIEPKAMLGYSLGEYACATLAGVLSLDDALMLAVEGAKLLSRVETGALSAVLASEEELLPLLTPGVGIAMISAPRQCVVAGNVEAMATFNQRLKVAEISSVAIPLGLPFHTGHMEPFLVEYRQVLQRVTFSAPSIPYISCVTGDWIKPEQATDPEHYLRLAGDTVRLATGFSTLWKAIDKNDDKTGLNDARWLLVEVGPSQTLAGLVPLQANKPTDINVVSCLRDPRYVSGEPEAAETEQGALLSAVARVWVQGGDVDWTARLDDSPKRQIPLPTYPFERQRFWVEPNKQPQLTTALAPKGKLPNADDWFYLRQWQETPLPASVKVKESVAEGRWLLVADAELTSSDDAIFSKLAERLRAAGAMVELAVITFDSEPKSELKSKSTGRNGQLHIATAQSESWSAALDLLDANPDHIVFAPSLNTTEENLLNNGFYSVLALGQALGKRLFSEAVQISVITEDLFPIGARCYSQRSSRAQATRAALLGPLRVIPQEYPNIRCRAIDIEQLDQPWQRDRLLNALELEVLQGAGDVALRSSARWTEHFRPYPLPSLPPCMHEGTYLPEKGVYLITGGLGNIGLTLAKVIAQRSHNAHIVLTTRRSNIARDDWSKDQTSAIAALEKLGASVQVVTADAADADAMQGVIADLKQRYNRIHGVIHAAGLVGEASFATVAESTEAFCAAQLLPKLVGASVLEQALDEAAIKPEFCILCSSLSPILGGLGFTAYAAANACLDAFVQVHNVNSATPWLSVNWEGWRFDESSTNEQNAGAAIDEMGLTPEEGSEAFERILALIGSQAAPDTIVLSTADLASRIKQWVTLDSAPPVVELKARHARPALLGTYETPTGITELQLVNLWESLLGIDGIGAEDSFFDLGGNSLLLTQLLAQIRKTFRLELSLATLFDRPSIRDMAALIEETQSVAEDREEGEI